MRRDLIGGTDRAHQMPNIANEHSLRMRPGLGDGRPVWVHRLSRYIAACLQLCLVSTPSLHSGASGVMRLCLMCVNRMATTLTFRHWWWLVRMHRRAAHFEGRSPALCHIWQVHVRTAHTRAVAWTENVPGAYAHAPSGLPRPRATWLPQRVLRGSEP